MKWLPWKWLDLSYEQWCGVICCGVIFYIDLALPVSTFPWWLTTLLVLFVGVVILMLFNVRIYVTYLKIWKWEWHRKRK